MGNASNCGGASGEKEFDSRTTRTGEEKGLQLLRREADIDRRSSLVLEAVASAMIRLLITGICQTSQRR